MRMLWKNVGTRRRRWRRRGLGECEGSTTQTIRRQRSATGARYETVSSIGDANDDVTTTTCRIVLLFRRNTVVVCQPSVISAVLVQSGVPSTHSVDTDG